MSECINEAGDEVYATVLWVTQINYICCAVAMLAVFSVIVKRRGNWVAILLSMLYATAYTLKGISFFIIEDHGQVTYTDCNGDSRILSVRYEDFGGMYYIAEVLFVLSHWKVAIIFLTTAITLRTTLEIERITMESQRKLLQAQDSDLSVEEVLEENKSNLQQLEAVKLRGRCLLTAVKIYACTGLVMILGLYIFLYCSKKKLVEQGTLGSMTAGVLDLQTAWTFLFYAMNLFTALAIFKRLDKRHRMRIKTKQLCMALCLGFFVLFYGATQFTSGGIQLQLWIENPLDVYPREALNLSIFLQSISGIFTFLVCLLYSYLLINIGRSKTNFTTIENQDRTQSSFLRYPDSQTDRQDDNDYVAMRLRGIYENEHQSPRSPVAHNSLNEDFDIEVEDLDDDPDFKSNEIADDLWSDPKIRNLLRQEFLKYNNVAYLEGREKQWIKAQSNLVSILYGGERDSVNPDFARRNEGSNLGEDLLQIAALRRAQTTQLDADGRNRSVTSGVESESSEEELQDFEERRPSLENRLPSKSVKVVKKR